MNEYVGRHRAPEGIRTASDGLFKAAYARERDRWAGLTERLKPTDGPIGRS